MSEKIVPKIVKLFKQQKKHELEHWAEYQALLTVLKNSLPYLPPEVQAEFRKYGRYKQEIWEKYLLDLETTEPGFAAELDEDQPLLPPSE
jgi:hypothetical protein